MSLFTADFLYAPHPRLDIALPAYAGEIMIDIAMDKARLQEFPPSTSALLSSVFGLVDVHSKMRSDDISEQKAASG